MKSSAVSRFVEMRRCERGAREQRVHLAAMMDVALQGMRKHVLSAPPISHVARPVENDGGPAPILRERLAVRDQPAIGRRRQWEL